MWPYKESSRPTADFSQFGICTGKHYPHSSINFKAPSYLYCEMYKIIYSVDEEKF